MKKLSSVSSCLAMHRTGPVVLLLMTVLVILVRTRDVSASSFVLKDDGYAHESATANDRWVGYKIQVNYPVKVTGMWLHARYANAESLVGAIFIVRDNKIHTLLARANGPSRYTGSVVLGTINPGVWLTEDETYVIAVNTNFPSAYWEGVGHINVARLKADHPFLKTWEPTDGTKGFEIGGQSDTANQVESEGKTLDTYDSTHPDLGLTYTELTCGVGKGVTNESNADHWCYSCPSYQYSGKEDYECKSCDEGEAPTTEQDSCMACPLHQYSRRQDAYCKSCAVGYVPNEDQSNCTICDSSLVASDNNTSCRSSDASTAPSVTNSGTPSNMQTPRTNGFNSTDPGTKQHVLRVKSRNKQIHLPVRRITCKRHG